MAATPLHFRKPTPHRSYKRSGARLLRTTLNRVFGYKPQMLQLGEPNFALREPNSHLGFSLDRGPLLTQRVTHTDQNPETNLDSRKETIFFQRLKLNEANPPSLASDLAIQYTLCVLSVALTLCTIIACPKACLAPPKRPPPARAAPPQTPHVRYPDT